MHLFFLFSYHKLNYALLLLAIGCTIGIAKESPNDASKLQHAADETSATTEQKSVKKELKEIEITPPQGKDDHIKENITRDEKSVVGSTGKGLLQEVVQKSVEKTSVLETVTESTPVKPQNHQYILDEDFVLNDDDISDSVKTGFYFFLILSSGAIVFIVFKIYRLRLSRAERKYGVQGDRSTQELTPLPISLDDGHSDDEDQTLFEIQRQNIRIL